MSVGELLSHAIQRDGSYRLDEHDAVEDQIPNAKDTLQTGCSSNCGCSRGFHGQSITIELGFLSPNTKASSSSTVDAICSLDEASNKLPNALDKTCAAKLKVLYRNKVKQYINELVS